ncbi:hypothetical protein JQ633_24845 [Bradyrhizobium tropiciagri]|uniref:hypothetical protein n=1 Tax=Bradyrhizobium tropiciagri TaxID=312253 RepID=UPI001BADD6FD|nr:hypothetical protein [Bradyrhizobium tropiciagri]MBR0873607.1 hypothetical protein [Bradyrhizobium tropiciagri]
MERIAAFTSHGSLKAAALRRSKFCMPAAQLQSDRDALQQNAASTRPIVRISNIDWTLPLPSAYRWIVNARNQRRNANNSEQIAGVAHMRTGGRREDTWSIGKHDLRGAANVATTSD